jgi:hypothetical protein
MQLIWRSLSIASLAATAQAFAAAPVPFSTLYHVADAVLVASIASARPIPASDSRSAMTPIEPIQDRRLYACELTLSVAVIIKARNGGIREGGTIDAVAFLPSDQCLWDFNGPYTRPDSPALWLLRTENGVLRVLVDNRTSVRPLATLSPETRLQVKQWKEPELALTYLCLKPGVLIPEDRYARSTLPAEMLGVAGARGFLEVYRSVYVESNDFQRSRISLVMSSFGYCLNSARRAAEADGQLDEWASVGSFLNVETERRTEIVDLLRMSWSSKQELLSAFQSPTDAEHELMLWACRSDAKVRARARDLLSRYFGVDSSTLPCIPCE